MTARATALVYVVLSLGCGLAGVIAAQPQDTPTQTTTPPPAPTVQPSSAATPQLNTEAIVNNISITSENGNLIVSVEVSHSFAYRQFMLKNPSRLVLEFQNTENRVVPGDFEMDTEVIKKVSVLQYSTEPLKSVWLIFDLGAGYKAHEIMKDDKSFRILFAMGPEAAAAFTASTWYSTDPAATSDQAAGQDHWKITEAYAASSPTAMIPSPASPSSGSTGEALAVMPPTGEPEKPVPASKLPAMLQMGELEKPVPTSKLPAMPQMGELEKPVPASKAAEAWTPAAPRPAIPLAPSLLTLTVSRGELMQFPDQASRVSVSDPAIADAVVVSLHEVVLNGKTPGNTTIMIWHGENVSTYEITVEPDLSVIQKQLRLTFPQEQITVSSSKDAILLTGAVSQVEIAKQAAAIAAVHAKSVVNLLQVPPEENRQVMLQVKFATVDRISLSQLGANFFSVSNKLLGTSTTQQFQFPRIGQLQFSPGSNGQPVLGNQSVSMTDLLNLFAFRPDLNVGAVLRLLQSKNVLEILAEPNLITVSGHEASFLAGGKFPFPVISSTGGGAQTAPIVTIQFRDFGVRLTFTPTVDLNGLIHLKVRPEVSSLDFANALTIQGFLIPAISTREVETEVDLREGETFAIAGLIDNRVTQVVSKIPGIGDLPILGHLFRSRDLKKSQSELLVLITPSFVKPFAAGEQPPLPQYPESLLDSTRPERKPAAPSFVGPRGHEPTGKTP